MKVEEKYINELMQIESSIYEFFKINQQVSDSQIERVISELILLNKSKKKGYSREINLIGLDLDLLNSINSKIDSLEINEEELIICLKRIKRSIEKWNKQMGRQGYIHFISSVFN